MKHRPPTKKRAKATRLSTYKFYPKMRRRRRASMKSRLVEFEKSCEFTNVSKNQIDWPMKRGAKLPLVSVMDKIPVIENPCHLLDSVSSMMFAYGDSTLDPLAVHLVLTHTIAHLIKYCNLMWSWAKQSNRSVITHFDLLKLLHRNKSRLHRFVKYYRESQRIDSTMMLTLDYQYETNEQFRELFYLKNDDNFRRISDRFNESAALWDDELLCEWREQRKQSFCCATSQISSFYAHKFHEAIGLPPLELNLIYFFDFIAREYIMEVVHRALLVGDTRNITKLTCDEYMDVVGQEDILFNLHTPKPSISRKRKSSSSDEENYTEMRRILEEIHADWYQKHHATVVPRQSFDPAVWFKMRKR